MDDSLRIGPFVNHLNLSPELTPHFLSLLLHLIARIRHQVTHVLQVPLHDNFDVFLTLIESSRSLQLLVLLLKDQV